MRIEAGTRALVTGASRGIGRATARALAARGAQLGLLARGKEDVEALAAGLPRGPGGEHLALAADIGKRGEVKRVVDRFAKRAGGIEVVVANAGIAHYAPFAEQELGDAEEMVRVNVLGTIYTVHAALPHMLEAGRGHIVVTASGAALRSFPSAAVYGATKAAGRGFAEALRHELAGTGVSVSTVFPGEIETDLHAHEREKLPSWRKNEGELPAEKVAAAIVKAVEEDRREVFVPNVVRLLGLNDIAPTVVDRLLARIRGPAAAPRRD